MEEERLRKIKVQYRESMSLLQKLYWFHLKQLVIRQDRELKQAQEAVARSETQKASEKRSLDQLMGVEAARRVVELKELSLRHCNNLCSQIEELEKLVKAGSINMVDQIKRFEELHTLQQEEHNRLRMQHDKNMGDFKESRADREIDEDLKVKKAQIQDLGQSRQADVLWLDLVHEVARGFLEEEEAHLIASGASLPGMGTPVRKYVSKS